MWGHSDRFADHAVRVIQIRRVAGQLIPPQQVSAEPGQEICPIRAVGWSGLDRRADGRDGLFQVRQGTRL